MSESGRPPRVVVVVSHLGLGGAERQTIELLRQLRDTEWAPVRVVCLSGRSRPYGETVRALGYPLSILARAGGFDVGRWLALRRLFRRERAGVVHAVNWFATGYSSPRTIQGGPRLSAAFGTATCRRGGSAIGASAAHPSRRQRPRQLGAGPAIGDSDM